MSKANENSETIVGTDETVTKERTAKTAAEPTITTDAAIASPDLRLRMKVWTDPATARRYLMPAAFMRDVLMGQPVSDVMRAYAMSDEDTKLITLTAAEWNALPFFFFREDGPAPRREMARPADVIE